MRIGDEQRLTPLDLATAGQSGLEQARFAERQLDGARRAAERGDPDETARQFEKLFAVLLVRELRRCMPEGPFGKGPGADVYEGWFDEHLGSALAERDSIGIAGMIKTSIQRTQAARDAAAVEEHGA
jgi:Rod binding domain-containing protein